MKLGKRKKRNSSKPKKIVLFCCGSDGSVNIKQRTSVQFQSCMKPDLNEYLQLAFGPAQVIQPNQSSFFLGGWYKARQIIAKKLNTVIYNVTTSNFAIFTYRVKKGVGGNQFLGLLLFDLIIWEHVLPKTRDPYYIIFLFICNFDGIV